MEPDSNIPQMKRLSVADSGLNDKKDEEDTTTPDTSFLFLDRHKILVLATKDAELLADHPPIRNRHLNNKSVPFMLSFT